MGKSCISYYKQLGQIQFMGYSLLSMNLEGVQTLENGGL